MSLPIECSRINPMNWTIKCKNCGQIIGKKGHTCKVRPDNELIPCACGCGKELWNYDKRWRKRKYIHNHATRVLFASKSFRNKTRKRMLGKNNPQWDGDKVGLCGLHGWIRRNKPRSKLCECCNKVPPYDLANISQEYKRKIKDFEWLCRKCHMTKDGRLNNLNK